MRERVRFLVNVRAIFCSVRRGGVNGPRWGDWFGRGRGLGASLSFARFGGVYFTLFLRFVCGEFLDRFIDVGQSTGGFFRMFVRRVSFVATYRTVTYMDFGGCAFFRYRSAASVSSSYKG